MKVLRQNRKGEESSRVYRKSDPIVKGSEYQFPEEKQ